MMKIEICIVSSTKNVEMEVNIFPGVLRVQIQVQF